MVKGPLQRLTAYHDHAYGGDNDHHGDIDDDDVDGDTCLFSG